MCSCTVVLRMRLIIILAPNARMCIFSIVRRIPRGNFVLLPGIRMCFDIIVNVIIIFLSVVLKTAVKHVRGGSPRKQCLACLAAAQMIKALICIPLHFIALVRGSASFPSMCIAIIIVNIGFTSFISFSSFSAVFLALFQLFGEVVQSCIQHLKTAVRHIRADLQLRSLMLAVGFCMSLLLAPLLCVLFRVNAVHLTLVPQHSTGTTPAT